MARPDQRARRDVLARRDVGLLGADFSVEEPPELVAAVRAIAAHFAAATV